MESTPLFLRRNDKSGYETVTGLIASFNLGAYPSTALSEDQTGVLITFKLAASSAAQTARLFRGRTLIATINSTSGVDLTAEQMYVDAGAPFGQNISYFLEVFNYLATPQHQYMQLGTSTPSIAPDMPSAPEITVLKDSSGSTTKSLDVAWTYDPQANIGRNPTHFLVTVIAGSDTLFSRKVEFGPYQYTYKLTTTFNVKPDAVNVTVKVAAVRGALSSEDSTVQAINQFNLLPAPVIAFSSLVTRFEYDEMNIPKPSYGFTVTITMPAGLEDVDNFEVYPTSSSRYFDKVLLSGTGNTATFTEDNVHVTTFPSYRVVAIKGDSRSPETSAQFSLTELLTLGRVLWPDSADYAQFQNDLYSSQEIIAKGSDNFNPFPSSLGTPALGIYYQGGTFTDWKNGLRNDVRIPYLRPDETTFDHAKGTGSPLMWKAESYSALFFRATRWLNSSTIISYSDALNMNYSQDVGGDTLAAQSFVWTDEPRDAQGVLQGNFLKSIQVYLGYLSGPGEDLLVDIYEDVDGSPGAEPMVGDEQDTVNGELNRARMVGHKNPDPAYVTFQFPHRIPMELGKTYWIVVWASPSLTKYRVFGHMSKELPPVEPFSGGHCKSELSSARMRVLDEDARTTYQGMTYRESVGLGTESYPEDILTDPDQVKTLDQKLDKLQLELGLTQQAYDGPCMLFEAFTPTELQTGFVEGKTETISSSVRMGNLKFNYGRRTSITSVADVVAKINNTSLYKAVTFCDSTLNGGELNNLFEKMVHAYSTAGGTEVEIAEEDVVFQGKETEVSFIPKSVTSSGDTERITHRGYDGCYIVRMANLLARYTENTRIRILPPYEASPDVPWLPRVNIGRFSVYRNDRVNEYSVAEFPFQNWSLRAGPPNKDVWAETPRFLDLRTLGLSRAPLVYPEAIHLTINGQDWGKFISDIDLANGILLLNKDLPDNPAVQVDYIYRESCYEYPFVDLNPNSRFYNVVLGKYVGIFLAQVQQDAPYTDDNAFFADPEEVQRYFGRRRTIFHRVFNTVDDLEAFAGDSDNTYLYLLGYYYVGHSDIKNTEIRDARRRGGGIIESMPVAVAYDKNRGARGFYDIGYNDGEPFSECNVVIRLPSYLKERFAEDYIRGLVRKYLALGVLPIVAFYDGTSVDVSDPNGRVVFPLPENIPSIQLSGYGVSYGEIYGLK